VDIEDSIPDRCKRDVGNFHFGKGNAHLCGDVPDLVDRRYDLGFRLSPVGKVILPLAVNILFNDDEAVRDPPGALDRRGIGVVNTFTGTDDMDVLAMHTPVLCADYINC